MESIENSPEIEIIESKEKLKEMELSGHYLFHGSSDPINIFEPRQAQSALDGKSFDDGDPAVFASSEIEVPIFRSIFHPAHYESLEGNFNTEMSHGENTGVSFKVSKNAMEASLDKTGYVYVFEKNDFELRNNIEWRSFKVIKPYAVFHASFEDIGLPIEVDNI